MARSFPCRCHHLVSHSCTQRGADACHKPNFCAGPSAYGHTHKKARDPVRSPLVKLVRARVVVGSVTTSECRVLYVFFACHPLFGIFLGGYGIITLKIARSLTTTAPLQLLSQLKNDFISFYLYFKAYHLCHAQHQDVVRQRDC